jgi:predicted PolB exonuclease-like 3'-5' exonuclease
MIFFDIETAPLTAEEMEAFAPEFAAPSNYKDADKIAANIAEQKTAWLERGALNPMTGRVLAIGLMEVAGDEVTIHHGDDERAVLLAFLEDTKEIYNGPLVGWNNKGFDIPFLTRRLWRHGIKPPKWWTARTGWGKEPMVIDLMEEWKAGDFKAPFTKLDHAAKFLGLEGKTGSHGKDFGKLYAEDLETALDYLRRDVELVAEIHGRIML